MAQPGALKAIRQAEGRERQPFNADERTKRREDTPVMVGGLTFRRRRKDWEVSRAMRQFMRDQESAIAKANRLRARTAELEVEQIEVAAKGESDREDELEAQISGIIAAADQATEQAELTSYRLLSLLLIPPAPTAPDAIDSTPPDELVPALRGWGPLGDDDEGLRDEAVGFLQPALDVEDAADLARELTGSDDEPDPQKTPSSENGST